MKLFPKCASSLLFEMCYFSCHREFIAELKGPEMFTIITHLSYMYVIAVFDLHKWRLTSHQFKGNCAFPEVNNSTHREPEYFNRSGRYDWKAQ